MSVLSEVVRPSDCGMGLEIDDAGLNLAGVLPIEDYDRAVPEAWASPQLLETARSAIVIGAGGGRLFDSHRAAAKGASLDAFVASSVARGCQRLRELGWAAHAFAYDETRDGRFVDLIALARLAGLGEASRLGLLLHPRYGPWLSLRAWVLTERPLPVSQQAAGFSPCVGCAAPCIDACPASAPRALPAGFDLGACAAQRTLAGPCQLRCAARRACIFGAEHAYGVAVEERLMRASLGEILAHTKS
jgi:hypothetical protein